MRSGFYRALVTVFAGTVVIQLLAFARQISFAAYFGADRTVDIYLLVVALATMSVFIFNLVVENACIPVLVAHRASGVEGAFERSASSLFTASLLGAVLLAAAFLLVVRLGSPIVGAGFEADQRSRLIGMSWYFVPWVMSVLPFYTLTAVHKAQHGFLRFLIGEGITIGVSLAGLLVFHERIEHTALAYGIGYFVGIGALLPGSAVGLARISSVRAELRRLVRPAAELSGSNAIASLGALGDRSVQSFLPPGGVAANSYSALLVSSAAMLISFRDIFIVPFSEPSERTIKLERAIIGLSMLAVPSAIFISHEAQAIVQVLLERGRFTSDATSQVAQLLQIQSLTLAGVVVSSPIFRMLQVIGRVNLCSIVLLFSATATFLLGMGAVRWLSTGLSGYAAVSVAVTYANLALSLAFVRSSGIRIDIARIARYIGFALLAALLARAVVDASSVDSTPLGLILVASKFGVIILACYALILGRLKRIVVQR